MRKPASRSTTYSFPRSAPLKPISLPPLRKCPVCGSRQIRRVNASKQWKGVTVRDVPVDQCDNCGEKFYDPHAIAMLSSASRKRRAG